MARFGDGVLTDGRLDRARLGQMVFADHAARRDLEQIIHPAVRARAAELERAAGDAAVVVHVIPLLVETGQADDFDLVVVVDVDSATQRARLLRRDGSTEAEAEASDRRPGNPGGAVGRRRCGAGQQWQSLPN